MKTKVTKKIMLGLVLALFSLSITAQTISGKGDIVKEVRKVTDFESISNPTSADIIVEQGETTMVIVKTDRALMPYVITSVINNTLVINIDRNFRNIRILEIIVTVPNLNSITLNGSGDLTFSGIFSSPSLKLSLNGSGDVNGGLNAGKVKVDIRGSGDVKLAGINDELNIHISGSGDVYAYKLKLNKCSVEVVGSGDVKLEGFTSLLVTKVMGSGDLHAFKLKAVKAEAVGIGSGDISLFATEYLKAVLNGSGNLYYKGNPGKLMINEKGSGEIIRK